ncbi:MAG: RAD55 family ATPase [Thermoproteota archaeon]
MEMNRVKLGVPVLDKLLPEGLPRRSFVLLAGEGGAGKSFILTLIASSFLSRGEKVVYVGLDDDPQTILDGMRTRIPLVDEYLGKGMLKIVDGYTARYGVALREGYVEHLRSMDPDVLVSTLTSIADREGMRGSGLMIVDSLNPLFWYLEPTNAYDFIARLRAHIAKSRGVLTVATLHTNTQLFADIASSIEFLVDALIIAKYNVEALEAGLPVRQILVKRAKGARVSEGWINFIISDEGLVEVKIGKGDVERGGSG